MEVMGKGWVSGGDEFTDSEVKTACVCVCVYIHINCQQENV